MKYIFIAERCSDLPVSTCCRVLKVSTSGFYQRRNQPVTARELGEAYAANEVHDIWKMSRHSYGAPRVRTELRLGRGVRRSKTTCERLMRVCGAAGIHYRRRNQGCTRPGDGDINDDLVNRAFDPEQPDKLWVMDVTEHPTSESKTVAHSDHGSVYTSWLFGNRLRDSGLLGSMGSIGDCYDNSVAEAFFSILQQELLDQHQWQARDQLATAIFDWIERNAGTATTTGSARSTTKPPKRHNP